MDHIELKKGHNIRISGQPSGEILSITGSKTVALSPAEFHGIKPKLMVADGDQVKLGSPLFFDKIKPEVKWASPASGTIKKIQFGPRRIIEKIEIKDPGNDAVEGPVYTQDQLSNLDRKTVLKIILDANLFPMIRQRPFNKIADPKESPRDIYISAINTAPLSVDLEQILSLEKNKMNLIEHKF